MTCYVTHLTLSHFRSHQVTRLGVDARPVAIYGPNGAGKTNLLEAVSMLSPGRGMRRSALQEMARRPQSMGWKITAQLQSGAQLHEIETQHADGTGRQVRIDGKTASQTALGRIAPMVWLTPVMDRLWLEGAEGRRRFLDRMTLSFDPRHGDHVLSYEKAMRERNRLLKDQVQDAAWYRAVEAQMAQSGVAIRAARHQTIDQLSAAQERAETAFPTALLELFHPDDVELPETVGELADMIAGSRPRDLQAGRSLIGPHRDDMGALYAAKNMAARDCSTGEQKALLISLVLANGRALKSQSGMVPILLLDEVAAHLDAARRNALYDEICALGSQAWMTGTGAELFHDLGPRAQYLEVSEKDNTSMVRNQNA